MEKTGEKERLRVVIRGAVQGVGFRPFAYRLAREMRLPGWVSNSPHGVFLEVEGEKGALHAFLLRLEGERPPRASIQSLEYSFLPLQGYTDFEIRASDAVGERTTLVLPDIATCGDCLREVFDPTDRRYLYPFTNCTNCGPRFSIIVRGDVGWLSRLFAFALPPPHTIRPGSIANGIPFDGPSRRASDGGLFRQRVLCGGHVHFHL